VITGGVGRERPYIYVYAWDDEPPEERPRGTLTIRPPLLGELPVLLQGAAAECARRNGGKP
jgi:hypothetical protein